MIPAIGFQEFTIGMLTPPKKIGGGGFIIRQPALDRNRKTYREAGRHTDI